MLRTLLAALLLLLTAPALRGGGEAGAPAPHAEAAPAAAPLPFFYDLYSFRGDTGTTTVVASFAVRVGELDREDVDGEVRYRFNVSLVLADTARGGVSRSDDSVFVALPRPLAGEHLLHAHVEAQARPSTTTVQRVVMIDAPSPGTGQLYTHSLDIPDYSGRHLMLSDIALGLPGRGGGWKRGDATLALLPSSHFPGGVFDVYYEVYNLARGNRYVTEIAFDPLDAAGTPRPEADRAMKVGFVGESSADPEGVLRELRRVDAPLEPGRYLLTVTVRDQQTGATAERSRLLQVREWEEGATLVSTCPIAPGVERSGCLSRPWATR